MDFRPQADFFSKSIRVLPYEFNEIIGFSNFDGWMNINRIHIEILKSPIDFKSFLKVALGHVLYGKNTRVDRGHAQKPI